MIQIACVSLQDKDKEFNNFSVPEKEISSTATKVHKLSTMFENEKKVLVKEGKIVACEASLKQSLQNFIARIKDSEHDQYKINSFISSQRRQLRLSCYF